MNYRLLTAIGIALAVLAVVGGRWGDAPAWLGEAALLGEVFTAAGAAVRPAPQWHPAVAAALLCVPSMLALPFAGGDASFLFVSLGVEAFTFGAAVVSGIVVRRLSRRLGIPDAPQRLLDDPPYPPAH
jgi:hypothetical protein